MDAQTKAFQALKPICVALGEAAKDLAEGRAKAATVSDHLKKLKQTLISHTARPGALHPKLAEYAFFPISQVLRVSHRATIQCLELCLQCTSILIDKGWQEHLPGPTAAQLVILCTLLAEKKPQGLPFTETTEELQASAFWCVYHIFTVAGASKETRRLLTAEAQFPQLGNTISVTLDAVEDSGRSIAQAAASTSLEALLTHVADREIHANFLPGIASKLTKALTPSSKGRTAPKVLAQCLHVLQVLLKSTLGQQLDESNPTSLAPSNDVNASTSIINEKWQQNAATQLRPALASVMRLRSHSNEEVTSALGRLCLVMLRACRKTLANCSALALETLVAISTSNRNSSLGIEFEMLLRADAGIASSLQEVLYNWLHSLPTVMQGADEQAKMEKMRQISTSYELLAEADIDLSGIDRSAATALRDSVVVTLTLPGATQQSNAVYAPLQSLDLDVAGHHTGTNQFESPLVRFKGQQALFEGIERFTNIAAEHGLSAELRSGLARFLRQSSGDTQIANFWLLLTASERAFDRRSEGDAFLNFPDEGSGVMSEELEEMYAFALAVLTEQTDEARDPRLQALALRALALHARSEGEAFRYELLDALYPVLHTLATPDEMLQRASITTLNILASSCGYADVKNLIVDNVDYLTNAVALKLNAFDVSPQAPQVLLMMLRLAGPTLLPFLEDTIESIFAALEDYHGYPLLVELLFKVLGVMAEEGVKTPQLAIEAGSRPAHGEDPSERWAPIIVAGLAMQLQLQAQDEKDATKLDLDEKEPHPKRPWGDQKPKTAQADEDDELEEEMQSRALEDTDPGPPASRTYNLLLKITELTQHFLPSASPSLRTSLLGLIRTTAPTLAKHENSFLPLINTLWPEVVARLDGEEAHITASALDIVSVLCESAGDFMRTRIIQLWPRLLEIHREVARDIVQSESRPNQTKKADRAQSGSLVIRDRQLKQALVRMENDPTSYGDTSSRLLWSALQAVITAVVRHVHLPPEYVDEALEMAAPMLSRQNVRAAFEEENSDATWLALMRGGIIDQPTAPVVPPGRAWGFVDVAG